LFKQKYSVKNFRRLNSFGLIQIISKYFLEYLQSNDLEIKNFGYFSKNKENKIVFDIDEAILNQLLISFDLDKECITTQFKHSIKEKQEEILLLDKKIKELKNKVKNE
jgi:hypothetical protein